MRFILLAFLGLGLGCAHAPAGERGFQAMDDMLEIQARELMLPGVSAALMERGRLVWTGARGWADVEARRPVTPETAFNIASLTKPMTAVLLMQLVERGALSLDTPMQRYDPSFTDPRITVGHVLSMSSESDPPGSRYAYNGNPYGRLGNVVTGVTGETLAQAFSTRLIEPLGLRHTAPGAIAPDQPGLSPDRIVHYRSITAGSALPYNIYGGVEPVATIPPDPALDAAANVFGTASDYARFADAVMRGRLLNPATLAQMWTPRTAAGGAYAYGWYVGEYRGHRLIYHYGYYENAWSAVMLIAPESELVFVALANGNGLNAGNGIDSIQGHVMACAVLRAFVDPALPCGAIAAANVASWRARVPPPPPEIASDPTALPRYAGIYQRPSGGEASVVLDRGRLWWQSPAGRYALTQIGPDRFVMKADNRVMTFVADASGNVTRIDVTYPGDTNVYVVPRLR